MSHTDIFSALMQYYGIAFLVCAIFCVVIAYIYAREGQKYGYYDNALTRSARVMLIAAITFTLLGVFSFFMS
jgi:hypothetical protein